MENQPAFAIYPMWMRYGLYVSEFFLVFATVRLSFTPRICLWAMLVISTMTLVAALRSRSQFRIAAREEAAERGFDPKNVRFL